jgi:predicted DNA-binding transcriptional regulator AlpA
MSNNQSSEMIAPALLTILQVCQLLNVSHAEFYRLNTSGKFVPLSTGLCRKRLYIRVEIEAWIRADLPHRKLGSEQRKKKL